MVLLLRLHRKYLKGSLCHARAGNSNLCLQYKAAKNTAQRVLGQHQSGKGHVSPRRPNALGTLPLHKPCVTSYSSFLLWKKTKNQKKKLLNPAESSRQMQSPSPTPPDMKTVTFTPALRSPPPQICEFFIFGLLRCLTSKPPCFPLKTFLFALYISALSPFCPLFFNMSIFFLPFLFHFLPASLRSRLPLSLTPSLCSCSPHFSFTTVKNFSSPLFVINQGSERRHSVRGIIREADEISGAHLLVLYGDLLGWDKQQASHHSQPNRLPACMCLFLLHCHDHCHCQGWSSPRRPAPC